jgi:hypothetical protein
MRLVLLVLLVTVMVGSAAAVDLATKPGGPAYQQGSRTGFYCAGINFDSAFYMQKDVVYGNVMDVGVGGPFSFIDFIHYGYGTPGPYSYMIRAYDPTTCTEICSIGPLSAADAASTPAEEIVDLCQYGCNLTGTVFVGIEALTCYTYPSPPWDCYPDVAFDYDGETPDPAVAGCGMVVDRTVSPNACEYILADGVYPVDFLLGIYVDECAPTATETVTWGQVKGLYR